MTPATSDGGGWIEKLSVYRIACRGMEVDNISPGTQERYKKKFKQELERAKKEARKGVAKAIWIEEQKANKEFYKLSPTSPDYSNLSGRIVGLQRARDIAELEAAIKQEKKETTNEKT
jgi:hypothetical protein